MEILTINHPLPKPDLDPSLAAAEYAHQVRWLLMQAGDRLITRAHKPLPEPVPKNGAATLLDLIEFLAHWKASGGDLTETIQKNRDRFRITDELAFILENTAKELGW